MKYEYTIPEGVKYYPTPSALTINPIDTKDYVFGAYSPVPKIILREDRDWFNVVPEPELQSPKFETFSCVSHATINAIEALERIQLLESDNYSERFLAAISGTKEGGNDPHKVAEYVRKAGMVTEEVYPTEDANTWEDYYQTVPPNLIALGQNWLTVRDFKHEYVPNDPTSIYEALGMSPLGVSVSAWFEKDGLFLRPEGMPNNHLTLMVGAKINEYYIVFDSYAPFVKKIPWDTKFDIVKRFYLTEKKVSLVKESWMCEIIKRIFT